MSYSEEEILKSSEDSGWNSSGTWNHYGSENYYSNRSSHPEYSSAWATYATLTKPSLPLKPHKKTTTESFTSSSGVGTGYNSLQQQQQFSKSQHHLNYASNNHTNHISSRHSTRRFSEDESTYLSTSTGSPSSFNHNLRPSTVQRISHKPLPPAKPPRNSVSSKSYTSSSSSSVKSSQVRQEFTSAWHKSIDLDHTLPPPEGYGNIRRSASNDVEGFASSFRHSNASNTTNNHLEYSIVPRDTSLVDPFLTNHLYDEIGSHRQNHHQIQHQQQQVQHQPSMTSNSLSNDNLDHNRSFNHEVNLSTFTPNRLNDQLHRSRQHSSWNYSSSNAQYHQQMQEVRAAIQAEVQKHVRSRSTHHPRCTNHEQQNQYETPTRIRESSLDRTNSAWNSKRPVHTQFQPSNVHPSKAPPVIPSNRSVEQTERKPLQPRAITDEYATVMHPPPPEVAMKSIRAVIKPLHQVTFSPCVNFYPHHSFFRLSFSFLLLPGAQKAAKTKKMHFNFNRRSFLCYN